MTRPRRVLPGKTHLITRRCSERRFFLRPDPFVGRIFEYSLGVACELFNIQLHAYVAMSNHYHLVVTDPDGNVSDFQQYLNSLLARAINCLRGRDESFWDRRSFNAVDLLDPDAVLERIVYTVANPVHSRLVRYAKDWGGATSAGLRFGAVARVDRPGIFFSDDMPEHVMLRLVKPPGFERFTDVELQGELEDKVGAVESGARGASVLGNERIRRQDWNASPSTGAPKRGIWPRVASTCKWARIQALKELREWQLAYRNVLRRFYAGERDVLFPRGTYWMCVRLGCPVET